MTVMTITTALPATQIHAGIPAAAGVVADRMTAAVHTLAAVCPSAPPGMQGYQDQVIGWVKWGVIGMIIIAALISIGAIVLGKIFSMPHASSRGAVGLAVTVIAAILFVTIIGVINGIVGSGC